MKTSFFIQVSTRANFVCPKFTLSFSSPCIKLYSTVSLSTELFWEGNVTSRYKSIFHKSWGSLIVAVIKPLSIITSGNSILKIWDACLPSSAERSSRKEIVVSKLVRLATVVKILCEERFLHRALSVLHFSKLVLFYTFLLLFQILSYGL